MQKIDDLFNEDDWMSMVHDGSFYDHEYHMVVDAFELLDKQQLQLEELQQNLGRKHEYESYLYKSTFIQLYSNDFIYQ
jgi:hypothetical protein